MPSFPMTSGVKYFSYANHSGYGLAAVAYVRALHNAGIPVWWTPLVVRESRLVGWHLDDGLEALPVALQAQDDASLQDMVALVAATGPKDYDTLICHCVPEHWPQLIESGKRNVGYTVWETDRLPVHWLPLLNGADKVLVPCAMNQTVFTGSGVKKPVHVVPHIRRHAWTAPTAVDRSALRARLGIPDEHFVFYSINVWDPRKANRDLVSTFARAFSGHDRASLVLKTSTRISGDALEQAPSDGISGLVGGLVDRIAAERGWPAPNVAVIAVDGLPGRAIDTLHAIGDCYVSLTHGEGWGMGAFDAAALGKPVLITGYGGPVDYLGSGYPGLIDYRMVPVTGWRPEASFQSPQLWAQPDLVAAERLMRRMVSRYAEFLETAAGVSERILNRFAEPSVAREMIAAIDD